MGTLDMTHRALRCELLTVEMVIVLNSRSAMMEMKMMVMAVAQHEPQLKTLGPALAADIILLMYENFDQWDINQVQINLTENSFQLHQL